jgi:hypothetical protein
MADAAYYWNYITGINHAPPTQHKYLIINVFQVKTRENITVSVSFPTKITF